MDAHGRRLSKGSVARLFQDFSFRLNDMKFEIPPILPSSNKTFPALHRALPSIRAASSNTTPQLLTRGCALDLRSPSSPVSLSRMQLNRSKSTEIIFYPKHRRMGPPQNIPTLEGIPRVTTLNVLGVTLADDLTFHDHVSEVISSGASYATRKLKAHGMRDELVQKVFQATVFSRIQYCSPAWWGFADSTDRAQLETKSGVWDEIFGRYYFFKIKLECSHWHCS